MKKYLYILTMLAVILISPSCSYKSSNPSISEPIIARSIDKNTSKPITAVSQFNQSDPAIYFTIRVADLPKETKLKSVWKYLTDGTEISSEITSEGTGYEAFTLKRSGIEFPAGEYEVTVTAEVNGGKLEVKGKFNIMSETNPAHLVNPVTSRAVDNDDKLNPIDITSEFKQTDTTIYFVVQSKDLPTGTKVSCLWYYVDSGDSLYHELTTDGNRNISFSLKPEQDKKLPKGKYLVTASIMIDGETESVSKEFEVIDSI